MTTHSKRLAAIESIVAGRRKARAEGAWSGTTAERTERLAELLYKRREGHWPTPGELAAYRADEFQADVAAVMAEVQAR